MNIIDINPDINISIITVNVDDLNVSIKKQRLSERINIYNVHNFSSSLHCFFFLFLFLSCFFFLFSIEYFI